MSEKPTTTDLETITMALEVSAIYLTPNPEARFTFEELLSGANELLGESVIDERDARIVVDNAKYFAKEPDGKLRLK